MQNKAMPLGKQEPLLRRIRIYHLYDYVMYYLILIFYSKSSKSKCTLAERDNGSSLSH